METIAASQLYLLLTASGVGLTLIALVGRGLYVWGRLSRQVDDLGDRMNGVEARVSAVEAKVNDIGTRLTAVETKVDELNRKVDTLITEVQQLNRMMVSLPNHRHYQDGNIVFTLPPD